MTQQSLANGVSTVYAYTPERGLLSRVTSTPLTGVGLDVIYTRDLKGRISSVVSWVNTENWAYEYDALGRLSSAQNTGDATQSRWYNYDLADNLIFNHNIGCGARPQNISYPAQGVASGRPHAPSAICGTPVSYDANGNTLSYDIDGSGPLLPKSFTYDSENRPLTIANNGLTSSFTYDPEGERASKTAGTATTTYLGNDAEWLSSTGTLTSYYAPEVMREGSATRWLHKGEARLAQSSSGAL